MRRAILTLFLAVSALLTGAQLSLPMKDKSVRFAVIGDSGTGEKPQFDVAKQMTEVHQAFAFEFTLMLGDNIYGSKSPEDFRRKFQEPYQPLLDQGVKFYASLGNHDATNEPAYKPFNMNGKQYYSFRKGNAEFFALDSNYMDPEQVKWLDGQLAASDATWKICFFHHPLYSDGRTHGPSLDLRKQVEPILVAHGVNLVLCGHEHFYERFKPQKGITYIVLGSSGQLRPHDIRPSPDAEKTFDTDRVFLLIEVAGDQLYFQTLSRAGETVDSGSLQAPGGKRGAVAPSPSVVNRPLAVGLQD
ncbi:MAG: metallophosphoesterase [Ignavibacteriota bacterium]